MYRLRQHVLPSSFYLARAPAAAQALVGKILCRRVGGKTVRARITETEAYFGETDTACHAHCGKTKRNAVMYEVGGRAYVYLCYGMYEMLNVVTGPMDFPEAVLIRGVEGFDGPGKLTRALGITRDLNGEDLVHSRRLWLEDDGVTLPFIRLPRVGIAYASARDRARRWRFRAKD